MLSDAVLVALIGGVVAAIPSCGAIYISYLTFRKQAETAAKVDSASAKVDTVSAKVDGMNSTMVASASKEGRKEGAAIATAAAAAAVPAAGPATVGPTGSTAPIPVEVVNTDKAVPVDVRVKVEQEKP